MATIRSYTSLEQSRKLAEILLLESADMVYIKHATSSNPDWRFDDDMPPMILRKTSIKDMTVEVLPCWSLSALLDVLPDNYIDVDDIIKHPSLMKTKGNHYMVIYSAFQYTSLYNNPVDACVAMIEKLHELNLL